MNNVSEYGTIIGSYEGGKEFLVSPKAGILCHKHKSIVILIEGEMFVKCTVTRKMYTSKRNEIQLIILSLAF